MDISVIVVSYNTADLLANCLSSLYAKQAGIGIPDPPEVIVVDNASADGSADMVRSRFPQVRLIANADNRGFAAANNQAMRVVSRRYILLLNSDTVVMDDALAKLAGFLDANPSVAVVGAQLQNPDGTHQHSAFRFPGLLMTFFDFFPINHRLINSRLNGRYPVTSNGQPFPIDHPLGACMMVRWAAIDEVGLLDEQFFMYCEEIDWCLRLKKKGWQVYCVPEAKVIHYGGQSANQFKSAMYAELFRSRARLFRKHHPAPFCLAVRAIVKLGLWRERQRAQAKFRAGRLDDAGLRMEMEALQGAGRAISEDE